MPFIVPVSYKAVSYQKETCICLWKYLLNDHIRLHNFDKQGPDWWMVLEQEDCLWIRRTVWEVILGVAVVDVIWIDDGGWTTWWLCQPAHSTLVLSGDGKPWLTSITGSFEFSYRCYKKKLWTFEIWKSILIVS